MDPILGTAVLAIISGLTWLAYYHPKEFGGLSTALGALFSLAMVSIVIWNTGIDFAYVEVIRLDLGLEQRDKIEAAMASVRVDKRVILWAMGIPVYMAFLWGFVSKLRYGGKREPDQVEKGE